jgi:hypothetical protein
MGLPGWCDEVEAGRWPKPALDSVPHQELGRELGLLVSQKFGCVSAQVVAEHIGLKVRLRRLAARSRGLEAALVPTSPGTFVVLCDPWCDSIDRLPFRIGHELAHTFFYEWDRDLPRRRVENSLEEEAFCDAFAVGLMEGFNRAAVSCGIARRL